VVPLPVAQRFTRVDVGGIVIAAAAIHRRSLAPHVT
jgi:hypothetical protein